MRFAPMALAGCLIVSFFSACTPDDPQQADGGASPAELLRGRWELRRGLRNNVETETLGDLYYEFGAANELRTNLLGKPQTGQYELDAAGEHLSTSGQDLRLPLDYEVRALTDSMLLLRARHQGFQFDFELARAAGREAT